MSARATRAGGKARGAAGPGSRGFPALAAILCGGIFVAGGCDDLLRVEDRDRILPEDLSGPAGVEARYAGALAAFGSAYAGGNFLQGQVTISGLMTDEWVYTGARFGQELVDRRRPDEEDFFLERPTLNLYGARASLEEVADVLRSRVSEPPEDPRLAEVLGLAGFTYLFFAENYCSGVPFSAADEEGRITHGTPLTRDEILQRALGRFEEALEVAERAQAPRLVHLARVGAARALVNLDRLAAAADRAAAVPTDFVYAVERSTNSGGQYNGIHHLNAVLGWWSLADREGSVGLPFRAADDPRVPWASASGDGSGPHVLLNYPGLDAPVPVAEGIEARLIEAEAALRDSRISDFLQIHERLRALVDLPAVPDPGTTPARVDLHFRERAFWLFATSHRLGDLRRLIRQYGRAPESVFPNGEYFKGGSYGQDVNLPVPAAELNNPEFSGCLDREA